MISDGVVLKIPFLGSFSLKISSFGRLVLLYKRQVQRGRKMKGGLAKKVIDSENRKFIQA